MTSKFPPLQQEQIKHIILDSQIRRLTNLETHSRLQAAGINITLRSVRNYKTLMREQAQSWSTPELR